MLICHEPPTFISELIRRSKLRDGIQCCGMQRVWASAREVADESYMNQKFLTAAAVSAV